MYKTCFYLALLLLFTNCGKDLGISPSIENVTDDSVSFKIEAKHNPVALLKDVACHVSDSVVTAMIPYLVTDRSFKISFYLSNGVLMVDGIVQESGITVNDFTNPVVYTHVLKNGVKKNYTFKIQSYTGLPAIYIETESPVVSKDDYVNGQVSIDANSSFTQPTNQLKTKIKGRGNSTWEMPKKPYRLKLDTKAEILGMPAAKDWVLLANFSDKTLMRNAVAFEIANAVNLKYIPRYRYVDVIMNGEFIGNYLLTEQVETGKNRVDIPELDESDNSEELITGGYLLEADSRLDADFWFITSRGLPVTLKSPEAVSSQQLNYINTYYQDAENALFSANFSDHSLGYTKYLDSESFVNWYLVNEIMKNNDAFFSSTFMVKNRNEKLSMASVWDYDIAAGNVNYNGNNSPDGLWVANTLWYQRLLQDPEFKAKVKNRWNELDLKNDDHIFQFINETASYLDLSQKENFKKWQVLYNYTWPNATISGSYKNEVQSLKDWLNKRIAYLDKEFNK